MLESNILLKNLLEIVKNNSNALMQNIAADIVNWILTIRLARYRCPKNYSSADINSQQSFCVNTMENYLTELIRNCIIFNNRTMAHKCVKMISTTLLGAKNMIDQKQCKNFETEIKNAILSSLQNIKNTTYSGALRWFTLLVSATSNEESQGPISIAIIKLLMDILKEISKRSNDLNSILHSRFGLYGFPFEAELFDTELPSFGKGNNNTTYCNMFFPKPNVPNGMQQQSHQNNFCDLKNFCASGKIIRLILI